MDKTQVAQMIGVPVHELEGHRDGSWSYSFYITPHGDDKLEAARAAARTWVNDCQRKIPEQQQQRVEALSIRARKEPNKPRYICTVDFQLLPLETAAAVGS